MRKHFHLLLKGLAGGLAGGLVLASLILLLYRGTHPDLAFDRVHAVTAYFLGVGILLGLLAGWLVGLNIILWGIVDPVLWKVAGLVPATAERIDALWVRRLDDLMGRVLSGTGGILRFVLARIFLPRLAGGIEKFNAAVDRYRIAKPGRVMTSQVMSYAALSQYARPVWWFFYAAYAVVALAFVVFWGVPFIR